MSLPRFSLQDELLASQILLPSNPVVFYAKFSPLPSTDATSLYHHIESARRYLLSLSTSSPLLESLLASVYPHHPFPSFYVYAISSCDRPTSSVATLQSLYLDNMTIDERGSFLPKDIYSCSRACSFREIPCNGCLKSTSGTLIPRRRLRVIYAHFLEAVRIRLLDDIVKASRSRELSVSTHKQVQRLQDGFVFGSQPALASWTFNQKYNPFSRPLVLCQLQILLGAPAETFPCLLIHPILTPTPYLPLAHALPLPSGAPIVLLPHGTPAYYRTTYEGPTPALLEQFKHALNGLGVGDWDNVRSDVEPHGQPRKGGETRRSMFIIAQLIVENKQGVDKGVLIVYPTALCLSLIPSMANPCQPAMRMLDLPTPLQRSPQAEPAYPSQVYFDKPHSQMDKVPALLGTRILLNTNWPTDDALQKIRSFTPSSHKDLYRVADEVGSYIEAVARERERERERLKREKEGASSSPRLARAAAHTPVAASSSVSSVDAAVHPSEAQVSHLSPLQNSFYPSPPHATSNCRAAKFAPTSPGANNSSPTNANKNITPIETTQIGVRESLEPSPSSYDPFETAWPQPSQAYMGMDLDFDIDMALGVNQGNDERDAYIDVRHHSIDFEDAFTDDDFSFFDQPSRSAPPALVIIPDGQSRSDPLPAGTNTTENYMVNEERTLYFDHSNAESSTWTPTSPFLPAPNHTDPRLPELSPPSGQTPEAYYNPSTPAVQFDYGTIIEDASPISPPLMTSPFGPISFGAQYKVSDSKYLHGKFSSSGHKGGDAVRTLASINSSFQAEGEGWKSKYNAITDPRISVTSKLVDVKRNRTPSYVIKDDMLFPSWMRENGCVFEPPNDEDALSEGESDVVEGNDGDDDSVSRPETPPPPYLPVGPTLLCTYFEHALLLTLGTPLRSSDSAMGAHLNPSNPTSVPTPVSPAATQGAFAEKIKSLEAIACAVAFEVVENNVWATAWKSAIPSRGSQSHIWPSDVKYTSLLLKAISTSQSSLNISTTFDVCTDNVMKPLGLPSITMRKYDNIIQVLPTALRFWEKLGLCPKGGKKDVMTIALYDKGDGNQRELQVDSWLESLKVTYTGRSYGRMKFGRYLNSLRDGHLPIKYDTSLRKSITCLISNLLPSESHYILLLFIPNSIMTFTSPVLRQALAAMNKGLKDHAETNAMYQLIPEYLVFGSQQAPSDHELFIKDLCSSIYNRTPAVVNRFTSRNLLSSCSIKGRVEEPAFTLARHLPYKVLFAREAQSSLDAINRHTLAHVGYRISTCGKWLAAACIDQRGESHDIGVWLIPSSGVGDEVEVSEEVFIVQKVWEFIRSFTKKADLDWRIVVSKLGIMREDELEAWILHLKSEMACYSVPPLHVSILCTEAQAPWRIINDSRETENLPVQNYPTLTTDGTFTDTSSQAYMLCPQKRFPMSLPIDTSFYRSSISEMPSDPSAEPENTTQDKQPLPHPLPLLPRSSTKLICVPPSTQPLSMLDIHLLYTTPPYLASDDELKLHQEITHNFYELSVLAKLRWSLTANPTLPFHLGAVETMQVALERDGELLETMMDG